MSKTIGTLLFFIYIAYMIMFYVIHKYDENQTKAGKYMMIFMVSALTVILDASTYIRPVSITYILLGTIYCLSALLMIDVIYDFEFLKKTKGLLSAIGLLGLVNSGIYFISIFYDNQKHSLMTLISLLPLSFAGGVLAVHQIKRMNSRTRFRLFDLILLETYIVFFVTTFLACITQFQRLLGQSVFLDTEYIYKILVFVIFQFGLVWIAETTITIIDRLNIERYTDPLTGLHNRRYFFEQLKLGQIKKGVFGLCVIDVDYFKKINDRYGHDMGDKVLINLSKILKSVETEEILVARIGGEEFALGILSDQIDYEGVIENLRKKVAASRTQDIRVTISGGLVKDESGKENIDKLYTIADQCLYKAKENGRNQTVTCNQESES